MNEAHLIETFGSALPSYEAGFAVKCAVFCKKQPGFPDWLCKLSVMTPKRRRSILLSAAGVFLTDLRDDSAVQVLAYLAENNDTFNTIVEALHRLRQEARVCEAMGARCPQGPGLIAAMRDAVAA